CLKLISQGAGLINHELNELLIMLGAIPQIDIETEIPLVKSPPIPNLAPELQQIINILAVDALSFDFIIQKTGMNAAIVSSSLLQLELMGLVTQLPGMRYQKL
ncbi:MAG: hypothetical protein RLZZ184_1323, partial [Cyanobacteriota bacterium]